MENEVELEFEIKSFPFVISKHDYKGKDNGSMSEGMSEGEGYGGGEGSESGCAGLSNILNNQ